MHQPRHNWADSGTLKIQVNPTQSTNRWDDIDYINQLINYHDDFGVALAGGDDERGPAGGGLLVDGQLDLPRVEVAQDLLQRRHVPLGRHVVEHGLLLLQSVKHMYSDLISGAHFSARGCANPV